jgi:hypothetical protein
MQGVKQMTDQTTDGVNLLGDNIDTIKKTTETPTDASNEAGLEANTQKTKSPECRAKS